MRAIVDIAATLDVVTLAEGVETEAQRACLLAEGCGELQGYLFGRAVAAEEALDLMTSNWLDLPHARKTSATPLDE